jgi:ATP/maltotriose-dependent transcriptional regulator MalT
MQNPDVDLSASVGLGLTGTELPVAAEVLRARLATEPTDDVRLALGLATYLVGAVEEAEGHLRQAFVGFQRAARHRRAALAAAHLARLEFHGFGNAVVASGWFTRGLQLLADDEDCVERGWLALGILGCSFASADDLHRDAELALRLGRRHGDVDLECRALGDYGLALVGHGRFAEGMTYIDQAMTMAHSGECTNLFVTGQVQCSFVSACERTGDVRRLEGWLAAATRAQPDVLGVDARPNVMLNHCRTEYGSLLCLCGRWQEAETELRRAAADAPSLQRHQQVLANCALADLRVSQGRIAEAAELLAGLESWDEARLPIARLQLVRGEFDLAVATCRVALVRFDGDRLRGSAVLAVLTSAELARGDLDAAAAAVAELDAAAATSGERPIRLRAALAAGQLARARGDAGTAAQRLEEGLRLLGSERWELLRGELHLELARALQGVDRAGAAGHAREALTVLGSIGAPARHAARRLLADLGEPDSTEPASSHGLTPREREILALLAQGMTNPQIAARLVISTKTAEHHVGAILRKLGVRTRSEAAVRAATMEL